MKTMPEEPMSLQQSLPKDLRDHLWIPKRCITLTLPLDDGSHTAYTVHWSPTCRMVAYNVALMPAWREQ